MEISSSNPLNIQLASFARNLEWKLKKQNDEKRTECMRKKELCQHKEKPLTISSLYYSGPLVKSTCSSCHPDTTSIFQKSFKVITLKDLLHKKCYKNMKVVKPCKQIIQSLHPKSVIGSFKYYFLRATSWIMYQTFSYLYKGILIHPEHIDCIQQAQDTGSSTVYFLDSPSPDLTTLCSIYFALYYSGLRPPLIGCPALPWYSRFLFSLMGLTHIEADRGVYSIISPTIDPFYTDYVNYTIDDIYIVPVSLSWDRFIHINFSTPYALSELEIKYSTAPLPDETDIDDVRDIDNHIRTDCALNVPVSATCVVAYVLVAYSTEGSIQEQDLLHIVDQVRGELIREKFSLNFKGKTEHIVQYALRELKPYLISRSTHGGQTEWTLAQKEPLTTCAMGIIMKKLLTSVVATAAISVHNLVNKQSDSTSKTEQGCTVKHKDIVNRSLKLIEQVETKLRIKLFKYCQSGEEEINKLIGDLSDLQILSCTDKEKWGHNIAKSLDMDIETADNDILDTRTYKVETLQKSDIAKIHVNIMTSLIGNIEI
ncbi:hypothetical protein M8J76_005702 [Diaphorina citri]|nr:hypothetical protein M8J76_005702 [Diaphorina citri]